MPDEIPDSIAPAPDRKFARGAKPTPRHILAAAEPYYPVRTPLENFGIVPSKLSFWLNNVTGICVSAEECFAKAVWSIMCGLTESFVPDAEVGRWAKKYGYYDGAGLTEVMDTMANDGLNVDGQNLKDGGYAAVDYSNESALQSAIEDGPVKLGMDANALPSGAGNQMGWFATKKGSFGNEDHCTGLSQHGRADFIYDQYKMSVPSGLTPSMTGYGFFTWSTIGFVTHDWLMGCVMEAWLRKPTTPGQSPVPPPPPPPPPSPPPPPAPAGVVAIPSLNVRLFGLNLGHTDAVTVPVTQAKFFGPVGFHQTWADVLKLWADVQAGDVSAAWTDFKLVLYDLGILTTPAVGLAPVVPIWQIAIDTYALVAAVWSKNANGMVNALLKLAADFGLTLSRERVQCALGMTP